MFLYLKRMKFVILVLVIAFTLGFSACAKDIVSPDNINDVSVFDNDANNYVDPVQSNAWERWTLPKEHVQLLWYVIGTVEQKDQNEVENEINKYLADKINASVKIIFIDFSDYADIMGSKFAAGEPIDIAFTSNWLGEAGYIKNASSGKFAPLNNYLKKGGILEGTAILLGEEFLKATKVDNSIYAIPNNKERAHSYGFLFRKDIVEQLNLNVNTIRFVEDLEPVLFAVKQAYPDMIPLITSKEESCFRLLDWDSIYDKDTPGALYSDNRDNKIINQFTAPESKAFYKTMRKYYESGYLRQDADIVNSWQDDIDSGMGFCISQSMKPGKDIEFSQGRPYEFVGVECTRPVISNNDATDSMMCIPASSKNADRAAMLLEIINTDKYLNNLLNYGIEGKHYSKTDYDANVIELNKENTGWRPNITWIFPNQLLNYLTSDESPQKFVKYEQYNILSLPLNNLGYVFNGTGSGMESIISSNRLIINEYTPKLFSGSVDPDVAIEEMSKKLKAASVDRLIDEMQKQYDLWLSSK